MWHFHGLLLLALHALTDKNLDISHKKSHKISFLLFIKTLFYKNLNSITRDVSIHIRASFGHYVYSFVASVTVNLHQRCVKFFNWDKVFEWLVFIGSSALANDVVIISNLDQFIAETLLL